MFTKRLVVFLILCLTNSLQLFIVSSSISLQGHNNDHAASSNLKKEQVIAHEVHCSRERSRAAWKIIENYLMPFVEKENYQISSRCRLHADNDMYRDQEQHKIREDGNEWRCGYCRKAFYEEKYLDKHFDNRHYDLLNVSRSLCLADVCGALHCDLVMDSTTIKTKCNPAAVARNKHMCESLADSCFSVNEGSSAHRLNELFLRQFCDAHTCNGHLKPFTKGGKKRTSITYIIVSALVFLLLLIFYIFMYLYKRGLKTGSQHLKRISKSRQTKKSS